MGSLVLVVNDEREHLDETNMKKVARKAQVLENVRNLQTALGRSTKVGTNPVFRGEP